MANNDSSQLSPVYKTATYTAANGDFVVATSGSFTVTLPVNPAVAVATSAGVASAGGVTNTPGLFPQHVRVRNNGSGTVTVNTSDSTTVDGIAGATGAVLAQYKGVDLYTDTSGNWVCLEGTHT
jgi:hypothetical protein